MPLCASCRRGVAGRASARGRSATRHQERHGRSSNGSKQGRHHDAIGGCRAEGALTKVEAVGGHDLMAIQLLQRQNVCPKGLESR